VNEVKYIRQPESIAPVRSTDLLGVRVMFTEDWHTQPIGQPVVAWEDAEAMAKKIVEVKQFPSQRKKTIIEVFQQKGDPAFICGVDGWITSETIEAIEKDINENRDEDEKDGNYLYEIHYSEAQTGDEGRIELPAYWDLREIAFTPNAPGERRRADDAGVD
jgi:hypothetical protein